MELKNLKINFLGDSITEGHGVVHPENIFVNRIAAETGAVCRNYGIGGTRLACQRVPSVNPVWDQDFNSRADKMDPDADLIVVFGGTNDFGHGDAPLGSFSDRTADTFYGAVHQLIQTLYKTYPGAQLAFLTPLHRLSEDVTENENGRVLETDLAGYVDILRQVCAYYSVPVLDLWKCSGMQPKVPSVRERYMPDGLHPNDQGHAILASRIANFLRTL